ncbi:uncharacterized protein [Temnothorax longispinosus]|uniref:Uncharacterized protein n=1 Tax=Temnothorax longispinosus TaxID=300112 RepID=A0A4S2L0Q0_9HYME|nr:hypothetical protein DBV15_11555 [Temnothorax longispinosus]
MSDQIHQKVFGIRSFLRHYQALINIQNRRCIIPVQGDCHLDVKQTVKITITYTMKRRYSIYLEDQSKEVPRSTRHDRRRKRSRSQNNDSSEDDKWRQCSYHESPSGHESSERESNSNEQNNVCSLSVPLELAQGNLAGFTEESFNSSLLSVQNDPVQSMLNVNESLLSVPEQDTWIHEANEELFERSGNDNDSDNDSDDDDGNICQQFNEIENESTAALAHDVCFSRLVKMLQKDEMNFTINVPITVRKAEMLLTVLKYGLTYNLPQSAIADLFKMLNSFLGLSILPDTRYLID